MKNYYTKPTTSCKCIGLFKQLLHPRKEPPPAAVCLRPMLTINWQLMSGVTETLISLIALTPFVGCSCCSCMHQVSHELMQLTHAVQPRGGFPHLVTSFIGVHSELVVSPVA